MFMSLHRLHASASPTLIGLAIELGITTRFRLDGVRATSRAWHEAHEGLVVMVAARGEEVTGAKARKWAGRNRADPRSVMTAGRRMLLHGYFCVGVIR
jgi:hypothetical protein